MNTYRFPHSFLTFRIDTLNKPPQTVSHPPPYTLNNARIQIECCLRLTRKADEQTQQFVLGASCKTERVGVDADIWTQPNADFAPIFCDDRFLNLKTYASVGMDVSLHPPRLGRQRDRQSGFISEAFDDVRIELVETRGERLDSAEAIVEATLDGTPLNARTTLETDDAIAVIEYPIKTMNANERDGVYQTDTGPILLPDLASDFDDAIERLELAYAAFNCPTWIEFLVRVPTLVADRLEVHHYSKAVRLAATNEVIRVGGG